VVLADGVVLILILLDNLLNKINTIIYVPDYNLVGQVGFSSYPLSDICGDVGHNPPEMSTISGDVALLNYTNYLT